MVQVKKQELEARVLKIAGRLFSSKGYHETTLASIAKKAGIAVGNIYSYFPSKLHLFYCIFRPWFEEQMFRLAAELDGIESPRDKLRHLLLAIWWDIPHKNPQLAVSLLEALASIDPKDGKPDDLLKWAEAELTRMLDMILPPSSREMIGDAPLAHLILMAYDGFVINRRLGDVRDMGSLVDFFCRVLLDEKTTRAKRGLAAALGRAD